MTTQRLLFAINHKDTEDKIAAQVRSKCLCVGAVTYREAVLPAILENHADIVLIRDTLGGSLKIEDLIRQIRLECPEVRIIFLSRMRQKGDALISALISYGIYDIIISDSVQIQTIVSYIVSPRTFRDVAAYFKPIGIEEEAPIPVGKEKKGGLFDGLFGKRAKENEQAEQPIQPERVNVDALRASLEEEATRKAQQGIQAVIDQAVETQTKEIRQKLKDTEAALEAANISLQSQVKSEAASGREVENIRTQMEAKEREYKQKLEEMAGIQRQYEERLLATKSTHDPEWFLAKSKELEEEKSKLEIALEETRKELEKAKATVSEGENVVQVDFSMEDGSIVLPDTEEATPGNPAENHVFLFVGAKHGVGNTTAALNTAATLAAGGQKTLLIELNNHFPLINHYFEFTNLTAGIDTACAGIKANNYRAIESAIVKPHALTPMNRQLGKAYKKLPGGLHFMLFSNSYLLGQSGDGIPRKLEGEAFKDLIYFLLIQLKYSYIIIDVQSDDPELFNMCVAGGFLADKLVVTLTQDPHALASAGYLITHLAKTPCAKLLRDAVFLVNQYVPSIEPKTPKIAKYLSASGKQCLPLAHSRPEYIKAAMDAVPYVYNSGGSGEYKQVVEVIR